MAHNKSENIQRGERQHQSIKKSVRKIRKEINKHLEHLETKILKEADTVWSQEKSKLTGFITEIEEKEKSLKELKNNLRTSNVHASKLQSFLGVHQIEQQVHQYQLYIEEQNETVREVDMLLKPNNEIDQILSKVKLIISLGEVEVDETKTTLRKETSVNKEAQVDTQEQNKQPNINNMTMNIETKLHTNLSNIASISDMIFLTDGRVIVVEPHGKVNILTSDAKLQKQLPIADGAWSVTEIKQAAIAITYPLLKVIKMINIENETITKVLTLDKQCWGLLFFNNDLVVGLGKNEIRTIDLEGNTLRSFEVKNKSQLFHLVNCNDAVIYTDYRGKAVSCIDGSGKHIWQYQQDLSGPKGLCTDTYGNVIVADWNSDRIIVISKDGQNSKVLVSEADELIGSRCICFCDSFGFICNLLRTGVYFTKVNLSYE
ncbi:uncharacterized protein LOC127718125 [Mytilus californianus]|uniref:uncharacterized protein LOC127718125 n=1 Tax=Mytilus californianus TaxID=6549 RepID=UPI002247186E|nr:uncharacterized protein LOC127718125 [Mytilus californianus]